MSSVGAARRLMRRHLLATQPRLPPQLPWGQMPNRTTGQPLNCPTANRSGCRPWCRSCSGITSRAGGPTRGQGHRRCQWAGQDCRRRLRRRPRRPSCRTPRHELSRCAGAAASPTCARPGMSLPTASAAPTSPAHPERPPLPRPRVPQHSWSCQLCMPKRLCPRAPRPRSPAARCDPVPGAGGGVCHAHPRPLEAAAAGPALPPLRGHGRRRPPLPPAAQPAGGKGAVLGRAQAPDPAGAAGRGGRPEHHCLHVLPGHDSQVRALRCIASRRIALRCVRAFVRACMRGG